MPMLISKFHRLIQSRVLWATFLIIIVFSFVIWGTRMPGQNKAAKEANAEGKLNGQWVSREEFRRAYFDTYMSVVLAVGKPINVTKKIDDEIRKSAWRRIVALKQAKDLGLGASDDEVRATIQAHPGFTTDGRFNPNQYNAFVQNFLANLGFSEMQFEEHVRGEIALQKLQYMVQQAVLIPPSDINRTFRSLSDKFDIEYVALTVTNFEKEVAVTREDAHKYFLADPEQFKIPEMVRVKYVQLPVDKYLSELTVTNEDDALAYYDERIDDYRVTNTVTETVTNLLAAGSNMVTTVTTSKVATLDFDQVKTNIFEALTLQAAKDRASEMATDFVVSLAPDRDGNSPKFEDAAKKADLEVEKLEPFALTDEVPGIDAGPIFNHTAFNLTMAADEYFSDAVIGSNYVYVIALDEKIPARVPEFEEVADKVMVAARENALAETLSKKANEIRESAVKAVDKGETFAKALDPYGLKPIELKKFNATEASESTNEHINVILRGVLPRNQGELTDLLSTEDSVVIAYVDKRTQSSDTALDSLKPQIEETVKRQRARIMFEDFQDYLLKQAQFEDRMKAVAAAEEGAEDTNDVPQEEPEPPQNPF
jgi:hypothetical protein